VQRICEFYVDLQGTKAIRKLDGVPVATDGPLIDAKETLVSFSIVDCACYDRAVEIAARVVAFTGDACEVRPIMEMTASPDA
jgi:hypothetical protein